MARGGARVSTAQPTEKSANTSRPPTPARAPAREGDGNQLPWPADKVERWSIDRLIPYAKNSRTHSDAQIAQLAASMQEWGWTNPVLADESGGVLCGHARILAARQLGFDEVPVMVARGWSDAQKRAYVIADNQLALNAGWDRELLGLELGELKLGGFDLALVGFGDLELKDLLADRTEGLTDPDDAPAAPEHPVSEPGDLWILGRHRLLCGSSTDSDAVSRLMAGERAGLVATDPPYLVDYKGGDHPGETRPDQASKNKDWSDTYREGQHDEFFYEFIATAVASAAAANAAWYIWHADRTAVALRAAMERCGLLPHQVIIWVKSRPVLTYSHFMNAHEPCFYGWQKGHAPKSDRRPDAGHKTVWEISSKIEDGSTGIHPTQKPIEIIARPIRYHTKAGELIYEPFSGSGTAIIAAEKEGRRCNAMELSTSFVDVAVRRWQEFTGAAAVLDGDGRTFDEIATARQPRMPEADTADAA